MSLTCRVCSKTFCNDHGIYSHEVQKCEECFYCGYSFHGVKQIRSHMKAQHRNYKCTECKRVFFLDTGRANHTRMCHGISSTSRNGFISELRRCGGFHGLVIDIHPNQEKMKRCNEAVEKLMLFMQHNTKYIIGKFVKGGSLEKGTSIKDTFDVDLVAFINNFESVAEMDKHIDSILAKLEEHIVHDDITWAKKTIFTRKSHRSVQFKITGHEGEELIDVDLLPAVDLRQDRRSIFLEMKDSPTTRHLYSACLTQDQIAFVKHRPPQVKELIRLVKYWKEIEAVDIRSYCVELIVIGLWEEWGKQLQATFDIRTGFRKVMEELSCVGSMKMTSLSKHRVSDYTSLPDPPAVIDPANPFVNVADNLKSHEVENIQRKAKATLKDMKNIDVEE
ncbi:2'-5'-oligoadenylate synthase 3-like isoform X2 [Haliotis rufescens]|nr:2'-5'-oligoadenylate synthase 3-like isoform X2 [Haliotis rufescens]XP_048249323.1 2'-5'-oligoadenylate synthase 3-like isoform X2 [Haliotis rufescens]